MNILHNMYQTVSYAMNLVVEKNRKNHLIHRIRQIIRQEQNKANEAYIALGKYYFEHLRQPKTMKPSTTAKPSNMRKLASTAHSQSLMNSPYLPKPSTTMKIFPPPATI